MKARLDLNENDILNRMQFSYASDKSLKEGPISGADLLSGQSMVFKTMSERPATVCLGEDKNGNQEPLTPRDRIYAKTRFAGAFLAPHESVFNLLQQVLTRSQPTTNLDAREAFSRTILDDNLCRLRSFYYDLQRPTVVGTGQAAEQYKRAVAAQIDDLADECRGYITQVSAGQPGNDMRRSLSPAELEAVQNFNHLQRVMTEVFELPLTDSEVYWEPKIVPDNSLDDSERGGMNRSFSGMSYSGEKRAFYLKYMPYYLLSMYGPLFKQALSRPKQLAATTTRPGPLKVPDALAARYGVPKDAEVMYHAISRFGLSNQKDTAVGTVPMRFYYTYQQDGVTKALELGRQEHQYLQLANRPSMTIPANVTGSPEPVEGKYVHYERERCSYVYQVGDKRVGLTQQQHQKILHHNAELLGSKMSDPNAPVHFTSDGALSVVMNKIFNENSVRAVSNGNDNRDLIPQGFKEKMQLMEELTQIIRPRFSREQEQLQQLRDGFFREFMEDNLSKEQVEDRSRKAAVESFRRMAQECRIAIPQDAGKRYIVEAVADIEKAFDEMCAEKSNDFAKVAAARYVYAAKISPFREAMDAEVAKNHGRMDPVRVIDNLPEDQRKVFDSYLAGVREQLDADGGLRDQLEAVYWGAATQNLMDLNYGPEGLVREGPYIGREGLPKSGKEMLRSLEKHAPELHSDPIQVANRLKKTFAFFQSQVSPYYSMPWPNLYRNNDFLNHQRQVAAVSKNVREQKSFKPVEHDVKLVLMVDDIPVRLNGNKPREARPLPQRMAGRNNSPVPAPQPHLAEPVGMDL